MSLRTVKRYPNAPVEQLPTEWPEVIRQILAHRGITETEQLDLNLRGMAHYSQLRNIDAACDALLQAREQNQAIVICGDFDADGATSTALLMSALPEMGFHNVSYRVPNRMTEGYGLSAAIVDQLAQQQVGLIITVDNGIAAHDAATRAAELGITLVITDHHLAPTTLPKAAAIVNPNQPGCEFPSKALAGVGVAFYLLAALRARLREAGQPTPNLADFLDLVALGTVADVVPLDKNNRILVQQGLNRIKAGQCRAGIRALIEQSGRDIAKLQASDLGFAIGPRINAAGRLDDISLGIECLLASSERAQQLAQTLCDLNKQRREIEADMKAEAESIVSQFQLDNQGQLPNVIVLYNEQWHSGVIGIVAGRVKERTHRPVIVFAKESDTHLKGSARSIDGVHIRDLLERVDTQYPDVIERFGGHAMAAGLSLTKAQLKTFQKAVSQAAAEWLTDEVVQPVIWSDGELSDEQLNIEFIQQLDGLGPWGQKFPEPIFDGEFRILQQRIVGEKHLKLVVQSPQGGIFDAISFFCDIEQWPNHQCQWVELVYKPQLNHFRGRTSVQLLVEQLRALR